MPRMCEVSPPPGGSLEERLKEGTAPRWGSGWERVLDGGLSPACKQLSRCPRHYRGADVSSGRHWTEEQKPAGHGTDSKHRLILQARPSRCRRRGALPLLKNCGSAREVSRGRGGPGQISSGLRRFPCLPHLTCLPPALMADGTCVIFLGLPDTRPLGPSPHVVTAALTQVDFRATGSPRTADHRVLGKFSGERGACGQLERSPRLGHRAGSGAQRSLKSVVDRAGDKTRHKQKHHPAVAWFLSRLLILLNFKRCFAHNFSCLPDH